MENQNIATRQGASTLTLAFERKLSSENFTRVTDTASLLQEIERLARQVPGKFKLPKQIDQVWLRMRDNRFDRIAIVSGNNVHFISGLRASQRDKKLNFDIANLNVTKNTIDDYLNNREPADNAKYVSMEFEGGGLALLKVVGKALLSWAGPKLPAILQRLIPGVKPTTKALK
jgi:hypothetical protein